MPGQAPQPQSTRTYAQTAKQQQSVAASNPQTPPPVSNSPTLSADGKKEPEIVTEKQTQNAQPSSNKSNRASFVGSKQNFSQQRHSSSKPAESSTTKVTAPPQKPAQTKPAPVLNAPAGIPAPTSANKNMSWAALAAKQAPVSASAPKLATSESTSAVQSSVKSAEPVAKPVETPKSEPVISEVVADVTPAKLSAPVEPPTASAPVAVSKPVVSAPPAPNGVADVPLVFKQGAINPALAAQKGVAKPRFGSFEKDEVVESVAPVTASKSPVEKPVAPANTTPAQKQPVHPTAVHKVLAASIPPRTMSAPPTLPKQPPQFGSQQRPPNTAQASEIKPALKEAAKESTDPEKQKTSKPEVGKPEVAKPDAAKSETTKPITSQNESTTTPVTSATTSQAGVNATPFVPHNQGYTGHYQSRPPRPQGGQGGRGYNSNRHQQHQQPMHQYQVPYTYGPPMQGMPVPMPASMYYGHPYNYDPNIGYYYYVQQYGVQPMRPPVSGPNQPAIPSSPAQVPHQTSTPPQPRPYQSLPPQSGSTAPAPTPAIASPHLPQGQVPNLPSSPAQSILIPSTPKKTIKIVNPNTHQALDLENITPSKARTNSVSYATPQTVPSKASPSPVPAALVIPSPQPEAIVPPQPSPTPEKGAYHKPILRRPDTKEIVEFTPDSLKAEETAATTETIEVTTEEKKELKKQEVVVTEELVKVAERKEEKKAETKKFERKLEALKEDKIVDVKEEKKPEPLKDEKKPEVPQEEKIPEQVLAPKVEEKKKVDDKVKAEPVIAKKVEAPAAEKKVESVKSVETPVKKEDTGIKSWSKIAAINPSTVPASASAPSPKKETKKEEVKKAEAPRKIVEEVKKEEPKKVSEDLKKEEVKKEITPAIEETKVEAKKPEEKKEIKKKPSAELPKASPAKTVEMEPILVAETVVPVCEAAAIPAEEKLAEVVTDKVNVKELVEEETASAEKPAEPKEELKSEVKPAPQTTPVKEETTEKPASGLEDGEIAATETAVPAAKKVQPVDTKAAAAVPKPVVDSPVESPQPSKKVPSKIDIIPNRLPVVPKLTDFSLVQYPESMTAPKPVIQGGVIRYTAEFLLVFQSIVKLPPPGLPSMESLNDDKPSSPRPGRSGSGRQNSGGPRVDRMGSFTDNRPNPTAMSSADRYAMSKKSGLGVFPGVMPQNTLVRTPAGSQKSSRGQISSGSQRGIASARQASGGSYGQQRGQRQHQQQQHMDQSWQQEPVEKLEVSENAWQPKVSKKGAKKENEDSNEEIFKTVRSLLNKLTLERFEKLSNKILNIGFDSEEILKGVINLIFDKALDEPHFASMYASLCYFLSQELPKIQTWIDMEAKNNVFRRILLNKCQEEFESGKTWAAEAEEVAKAQKRADDLPAEEREKLAEKDFAIAKAKRRALGNIQFIGELFKRQMLTEKIIHACVSHLLRNISDPEEEDIESLCKLMTTVGARIDHEKAKGYMDTYFVRADQLSKHQGLPSRIRFMLKDLIDLRKSKWTLRAVQASNGPKTIAQIHEEAERKKRAEEEENKKLQGGKGGRQSQQQYGRRDTGRDSRDSRDNRDSRGDHRGDHRGAALERNTSDGWSVASSARAQPKQEDDFSRFGMKPVSMAQNFNLGAPSNYKMHTGSRGWNSSNAEKKEAEPVKTMKNSFALLQEHNEHTSPTGSERKTSTPASPSHSRATSPARSSPSMSRTPSQQPATKPSPPGLTEDGARTKMKATIEEYWSVKLVEEVVLSVKEIGDEFAYTAVSVFLESTMETKVDRVIDMAGLFATLADASALKSSDIKKGLQEYAEYLEDLIFDMPQIYKFFGVVLGIVLAKPKSSILQFPKDVVEILSPSLGNTARICELLTEMLSVSLNKVFEGKRENLSDKFECDWTVFFPKPKDDTPIAVAYQWLAKSGYLWDVGQDIGVSYGLGSRFTEDCDSIVSWMETIPETVRSSDLFPNFVTKAVLEYVAKQTFLPDSKKEPLPQSRELFSQMEELVKKYVPVCKFAIGEGASKEDREVLVVSAVEEFVEKLKYPKDLLEHLLRIFVNIDLVSPESQLRWEKNAEKGSEETREAVKNLNKYFRSISQ